MAAREIEHLIGLLAKLPGLGPRSARRLALHLIRNRAQLLDPLATALAQAGKEKWTDELAAKFDDVAKAHVTEFLA